MSKIVGIVGFIGSGKDTAADYLVNFYEFRRDSFAAPLKDAVASVFNWDRELLEGRTLEAREWREQIDPWWAIRLSMPNLTPRWVLQYWGTEVCRIGFHNDIWIASLENRLRKSPHNTVISDCRFPNEIRAIKNAGGAVIRIRRHSDPAWFEDAVAANKTENPMQIMTEKWPGVHASEWSWIGEDFDYVVENNSTLERLYSSLAKIVQEV